MLTHIIHSLKNEVNKRLEKSFLEEFPLEKMPSLLYKKATMRTWGGHPTDGIIYEKRLLHEFDTRYEFIPFLQPKFNRITTISLDEPLKIPRLSKRSAFYFPSDSIEQIEYDFGEKVSDQYEYLSRKKILEEFGVKIEGFSKLLYNKKEEEKKLELLFE